MLHGMRALLVVGLALAAPAPEPAAEAAMPFGLGDHQVPTLAPILKRTTPAVVNIATRGRVSIQQNPLFSDPFFRRFFDLPPAPRQRRVHSVGSGVIVDAQEGYVLTNDHVIANADKIFVKLKDRRQFTAELVGTDPDTDIAVLKIPPEDLTALAIGDSDALEVGDFVIAIGNPFGIGQTVTSGIVSALRRSGLGIEGFEDFIQTDASINPGNSGGALVTLRGDLIGINTAIIGPSGGNVGIGFAIPINMARRVMAQLIAHGEMRRGRLGVSTQDLTPDLAAALGSDLDLGAVITQVAPRSSAAKAGLKAGDIVIAVDGEQVRSAADMRNKVGLSRVGKTIELTVLRDGAVHKISTEIVEARQLQIGGDEAQQPLAGATISELAEDSPMFGRIEGVQVIEVERGSPASRIGLRKDDIIVEANRKPVHNLEEFVAAVKSGGKALVLKIRRGNAQVVIVVR
ncbi:MAG: DegQ family serine endoprotease [Proteobacteria bacterium]|nr:DegQ family serine endoprotease [Pseudomonadota bacterium]